MKFLHAADIHLDSPMAGLRARADLPADLLKQATRRAFSAMVDLAIAEDVAFVVIAGDLYDGDWKDFSTGLFLAAEMRRLARPCFVLRGNHDAQSVITSRLTMPGNVREFSSRTCQTHLLSEHRVALHGHSFPNRAVPEDLAAGYAAPRPGLLNLGVLHTSGEDPGEHETYAPCRVAGLAAFGYDYWALGHIHARRVLAERPWIVFPGNLQGRHPKETGAKGCTLVTVEDGHIAAVEHRSVDVLRWAALEVDVTGADVATLTGRLAEAVRATLGAAEGRPVIGRVVLTGTTPLQLRLRTDPDQLAAECVNAGEGRFFVESLTLRTRAPAEAPEADLAPLREAFLAGLDDPAVMEPLRRQLAELRDRLPPAAREGLDLPGEPADLAAEAWEIVAAALAAETVP
jgi:DNA repair exonuclease SbcCD nuclease subunit